MSGSSSLTAVGATRAAHEKHDAINLHFLRRGNGLEFEMEARWIRAQIPPDCRRIAEIGCGNGSLFPWLCARSVVGVDCASDGLKYTRKRFPRASLVAGSAEHLPVAAESLDAIVMQHVIEHIEEFRRAGESWFRALRRGGRLILVTPNASFRDPSVYDDPTHVHIFTRVELKEQVERMGFDVCDVRTLGVPLLRSYGHIPGGWRLRRAVIAAAGFLSRFPGFCDMGQSLCCVARRPE